MVDRPAQIWYSASAVTHAPPSSMVESRDALFDSGRRGLWKPRIVALDIMCGPVALREIQNYVLVVVMLFGLFAQLVPGFIRSLKIMRDVNGC